MTGGLEPVPERPDPFGMAGHPPADGQDDAHHDDEQEQQQADPPRPVLDLLVARDQRRAGL